MLSFTRLFAVLAGLAVLARSGASPTAIEKRDVHIAVGGKSGLYYLPLTIAEKLGYFEAEGLRVRISDFSGGSAALRAVVGGSADVVTGAYEHTIALQGKKQNFQSFVLLGRLPQIALGVATPRASSFRSFRDLKGMKVGVSAPGSSTAQPREAAPVESGTGPEPGRVHHRRRKRCRGGRGLEERRARRHLERRTGHDEAGDGRCGQDRRRHPDGRGHPGGLGSFAARGLSLRSHRVRAQEPGDGAGAGERHRPRRQVDRKGERRGRRPSRSGVLPHGRPSALHGFLRESERGDVARWNPLRGRRAGPLSRRSPDSIPI